MKRKTSNPEETGKIANQLAQWLRPGMTILLEGPLGSGKTTFVQYLGRAMGIKRAIKSPTYTIVKEYALENHQPFIHVDAYRLEEGGADSIDLDHYLDDESIVLIEWSQYLEDYLPENYLLIQFNPQTDLMEREIDIQAVGSASNQYQNIVTQLEREL